MQNKLQALADLITSETLAELHRQYPDSPMDWTHDATAHIHPGTKYTRVDVGRSGTYMVDADGNIFGIKAYGVIHRGHRYGTLDTIHDYFWGGYVAVRKSERKVIRLSAVRKTEPDWSAITGPSGVL